MQRETQVTSKVFLGGASPSLYGKGFPWSGTQPLLLAQHAVCSPVLNKESRDLLATYNLITGKTD